MNDERLDPYADPGNIEGRLERWASEIFDGIQDSKSGPAVNKQRIVYSKRIVSHIKIYGILLGVAVLHISFLIAIGTQRGPYYGIVGSVLLVIASIHGSDYYLNDDFRKKIPLWRERGAGMASKHMSFVYIQTGIIFVLLEYISFLLDWMVIFIIAFFFFYGIYQLWTVRSEDQQTTLSSWNS